MTKSKSKLALRGMTSHANNFSPVRVVHLFLLLQSTLLPVLRYTSYTSLVIITFIFLVNVTSSLQ